MASPGGVANGDALFPTKLREEVGRLGEQPRKGVGELGRKLARGSEG
jgi:hypothetical protein